MLNLALLNRFVLFKDKKICFQPSIGIWLWTRPINHLSWTRSETKTASGQMNSHKLIKVSMIEYKYSRVSHIRNHFLSMGSKPVFYGMR